MQRGVPALVPRQQGGLVVVETGDEVVGRLHAVEGTRHEQGCPPILIRD
jgi:hypothetical protein